MFSFTKFQILIFFLAVLAVRITIGAHFFQEGINKIRSGDFTSKYFLAEARGPLADFFKSHLDDPDGAIRLCLKSEQWLTPTESELSSPVISPEFTFMVWGDFVDQIKSHYQFDNPELIAAITRRVGQFKAELDKAGDDSLRAASVRQRMEADLELLNQLDDQSARADGILENHKQLLLDFLDENRAELIAHFGATGRLKGFARDGDNKEAAALQVASLREQVASIKADRQRKFQGWISQVEAMWDSLELQLNELAVDVQRDRQALTLHRPFDQPFSWQKIIDRVVPWFDTILGALLIVGLFTRFASLAAAAFLASVIATQPPWIPGAAPTLLYMFELVGCLLLFVVAAGRLGGLDFFLWRRRSRQPPSVPTPRQAIA